MRRFAGVVCFCLVLLGAACGAGKPPQPLTVQELALQPAGAETVRVAYDYLLSDYLQPLHPQDLLAAAWAGVQQQARAGGADAGDAPTLRGSPTGDFAAFAAAFNRVTAGKDAAPYAFAAVKAMAQSLHDDHTTLVPADLYKQALALLQGGDTQLPLLQSRMLPGGIGYLRLLIFPAPYVKLAGGKTLAESLDAALDAFEQQGVKGWVLDLRGNAGGAIDSVSTLTGRFIPNGVVSALRSRHGVRAEELADGHYYPHRHPLAVLIDGNSASASELAASALRDYGAARLFGQKTAGAVNGAGLVPLPGQAALEYTVFTALDGFSSTPLDKVGVQPDQPTAGRVGSTDPALSAASAWLAGLGASAQPPSASAAPRGTALTAAQVGQTLGGYSAQVADVAATPDLKLLGELAIDTPSMAAQDMPRALDAARVYAQGGWQGRLDRYFGSGGQVQILVSVALYRDDVAARETTERIQGLATDACRAEQTDRAAAPSVCSGGGQNPGARLVALPVRLGELEQAVRGPGITALVWQEGRLVYSVAAVFARGHESFEPVLRLAHTLDARYQRQPLP